MAGMQILSLTIHNRNAHQPLYQDILLNG